ncbi:IS481 family transposase, partial [Desulfonauticus submarinus]
MQIRLHKNATTTPALRKAIQESTLSERKLAQKYGISRATVRKWKKRDFVYDAPINPRNPHTSLNPEQEFVVLELRKTFLLSLDDLLVIIREFFKPDMTRSSLYRLLKRHNMHRLSELIPQEEGAKKTVKTFKDYKLGFVHIDVKYLPKMPDEDKHKYLFVAIDRATRWVYLEIRASKSEHNASSFLENLIQKASFKIKKVLTDNGTEFTDRFQRPDKQPSGNHLFDQVCSEHNIEHRLIKPYTPQTNGMVERFNGRISEVIKQTRFVLAQELKDTIYNYLHLYNYHIPQASLGYLTPVQALKKWQETHPELFVKTV